MFIAYRFYYFSSFTQEKPGIAPAVMTGLSKILKFFIDPTYEMFRLEGYLRAFELPGVTTLF